jgi:hypothetical protein
MPKKTATARGGAQRNRPKVQKSFELVRQAPDADEQEVGSVESISEDAAPVSISTMVHPTEVQLVEDVEKKEAPIAAKSASIPPVAAATAKPTATDAAPASKKSAAARLAAQRQATRAQQQRAASLITAEHYAYVLRDLRFIAILAAIMFAVIIILHFVPGIGS